jgi:hypothetical protein
MAHVEQLTMCVELAEQLEQERSQSLATAAA